jgi:tRNA pseudouridine38-40 synthase
MKLKIIVAYEGTAYFGWQKTKEGPSIEEELEKALFSLSQEKIILSSASRTDRGVHAEGQVVSFTLLKPVPLPKIVAALNSYLPRDIRVLSISEEKESFHPTLDALSKEYHYKIITRPVCYPLEAPFFWHYPKKLSLEAMRLASSDLLGIHDFSAFANHRKEVKNTITEVLSITIDENPHGLTFCIKGTSFLYKMVRNIVGTLVYIGEGKLEREIISRMLQEKKRSLGGVSAPAEGLVLKQVIY